MKVSQLILELSQLPQDAEVFILDTTEYFRPIEHLTRPDEEWDFVAIVSSAEVHDPS